MYFSLLKNKSIIYVLLCNLKHFQLLYCWWSDFAQNLPDNLAFIFATWKFFPITGGFPGAGKRKNEAVFETFF
jgi:hypothetical protein